jgi:hypothetical protein
VGYDQCLQIQLGGGWEFGMLREDKCALVRLIGITHGFGFDQRYVNLFPRHITDERELKKNFSYPQPKSTDTAFRLQIPQNQNLLPPGYYYLFLVSKLINGESGCPSKGHIVQIL